MIKIDEDDPVGELEPSFPYRNVQIQRGVDVKDFYDLQSEIGRGKFGTVYKCREKSTGLHLAAKFVSTSRKEDKRNVEREIDIMRSLQHPRLIQLYDAFEKDKTTVVILELIEGGELFERVIDDDFVLTERSCTVFMRQICEGMEFIHKQNILHLDMKPENILCLTKTGNRIKIIDFGLARKYDPEKKLQVLFGTPEFVAPEVVNFDRIGYGTDMWSIGVICYVLLSGLSPFMGETDIETMANVTISKWDFDDDAFLEISQDAKDFISNLLVKDKEKRLTATQCLSHPWLRKKAPAPAILQSAPTTVKSQQSDLDLAKDNLKNFVERWNEHPNSPYLFDTSYQTISPCVSFYSKQGLRSGTPSSSGCSPSPCGSISSLMDSSCLDTPPPGSPVSRPIPVDITRISSSHTPSSSPKSHYLDRFHIFDRRASDSSCMIRNPVDVVSRLNLAEEIKKLSDKLLRINHIQMTRSGSSDNPTDLFDFQPDNNEHSQDIPQANPAEVREELPLNNSFYCSSVTTMSRTYNASVLASQVDCEGPRRKYKFSNMNRDVPIPVLVTKASDAADKSESSPDGFSKVHPVASESPQLKSNLLELLDRYESEMYLSRGTDSIHRNSLSVEWSEIGSLGQRTMKSLTNFIETSRNVQNKPQNVITPNVE